MAEQILLPADDARRIGELLRDFDDDEAEHWANLLHDHAEEHAFEDRFSEIGPIDEVVECAQEAAHE